MLLLAIWAGSPGNAVEGGLRAVMYAALATIVLAALPGRSQLFLVAKLAVGGVVVIALVTYIALLMLEALEREPESFVTLGLLGDLEVREGDEEAARSRYRQALEVNPLDVGLQTLAAGAADDEGP